jgi:hypothetical protein
MIASVPVNSPDQDPPTTPPSLPPPLDASTPPAGDHFVPRLRGGSTRDVRDRSDSPPPSVVPLEDASPPARFSIRLLFPDGGVPQLSFPVHHDMPVSLLRRDIALFLNVPTVHLLVGFSWTHDLLEHTGSITDRVFPGTHDLCPYLQPGSRVNVYFERPALDLPLFPPPSLSSPDDGAPFPLADLGDALGSNMVVSRRRPGPTTGERGGRSTGEHGASFDDIIRAQLAQDALFSSSTTTDAPSSIGPSPLSDQEFNARKSRREALFEGYRRVKRSRLTTGSRSPRNPELEALSTLMAPPPLPPASRAASIANLREEIRAIKVRMRAQWSVLDEAIKDEAGDQDTWLIPDDLLDSYSPEPNEDDTIPAPPPPVGDPPSILPRGPPEPPAGGGPGLSGSASLASVHRGGFRDGFLGTPFFDGGLGWCTITAWGECCGASVLFYLPLCPRIFHVGIYSMPFPGFFSSEADVFAWLRLSALPSVSWRHKSMPIALGNDGVLATPPSLVHGDGATDSCATDSFGSVSSTLPSSDGESDSRVCPPVSGRSRPLRPITLSPRQLRRVMAARETLFKFGTFVPRNDREANASPEAPRWRAGRDLEWLRLNETGTFESDWTIARMESAFPS